MSSPTHSSNYVATLVVRRVIRAPRERLFDAWTDPAQVLKWWGPQGVRCTEAQMDLRVGGSYQIANLLPNGSVLWIGGVFEVVERPRRLVYSWQVEGTPPGAERVTVSFAEVATGTEVIVTHERIHDGATRDSHEAGWMGCLDGLERFITAVR